MSNEEIKPGSTVKLKSGGPLMTVNRLINDGWHCIWFDKNHERKEGSFTAQALEHALM